MPVKIAKLFKNSWFQSQLEITRLLYIYLATSPDLNSVGVFSPNLEVACLELNCPMDILRHATQRLVDKKYIYVKKFDDIVYFIIPAHFNSLPKSEATITKVNKELKSLPEGLVKFLEEKGITVNSKVKVLEKPSVEEVVKYGLSFGYLINGKDFIDYYEEQSKRYGKKGIWVDSRGKQVRDWKAKLRKIWFKDENKIKTCSDAPKGYESFHVIKEGTVITPEGWRGGKPYHKSISIDILLKREYEQLKRDS